MSLIKILLSIFLSNSIGAMRVKNVCIEFRNYCEAQNVEEWVISILILQSWFLPIPHAT